MCKFDPKPIKKMPKRASVGEIQSLITNKYKVINGIFEGRIFVGREMNINGEERVWDLNTEGRSYPLENCKKIE